MRKIVSTFMLFLLTCFGGSALATFNGPPIPRAVPFTEGGKTYAAYAQTWHPHYGQSVICYYPADLIQAYRPVITTDGIIQFGYISLTRVLLNPVSFNQAWDSTGYASTGLLCALYWSGNWQTPLAAPTNIMYAQYGWNDWYFNASYNYDHDLTHNVRAVGVDVKINVAQDFIGQFYLGAYASGDVVIQGVATPSYLSFPLAGYTAYTAPVSAVMDHSMTAPYGADTNRTVTAFNGEVGTVGPYKKSTCYRKLDSSAFLIGVLNYTGTSGSGGNAYLCYDGHPGYDYPRPLGTDIFAPAAGKLCVATTNTSQPSPANVWRSSTECGAIPNVIITRWKKSGKGNYNTFYIFHTEYINGVTGDYTTVFLHSNNLESSVWSTVASQGYANVTRGQHVAAVGNVGTGGYHVHMEVYKKNTSGEWVLIDPYGDGVNNILWAPFP
jgi:murein DD-endopeptidase MepM/ murein hydrolase activator NlpD